MKTSFFFLLAIGLLNFFPAFCQTEAATKTVYYAVIVRENGKDPKRILYDVTDSSLMLKDLMSKTIHSVSYRDISKVKIGRKGTTGIGIGIGAVAGTALGGIIGILVAPPQESEWFITDHDVAIASGLITGFVVGTVAGGIIGSQVHKEIIQVNHDFDTFSMSKREIKKYCQKYLVTPVKQSTGMNK